MEMERQVQELTAQVTQLTQSSEKVQEAVSRLLEFMYRNDTLRIDLVEERKKRELLESRVDGAERRIAMIWGVGLAVVAVLTTVTLFTEIFSRF